MFVYEVTVAQATAATGCICCSSRIESASDCKSSAVWSSRGRSDDWRLALFLNRNGSITQVTSSRTDSRTTHTQA